MGYMFLVTHKTKPNKYEKTLISGYPHQRKRYVATKVHCRNSKQTTVYKNSIDAPNEMRASAQTRVEVFSSGGAFPSSPSDLLKAKQPRSNLVEPQPS